jgi:hypothetical protein
MLSSVGTVLGAFASDHKRKKPIVGDLKTFQKQIKEALNWTNAKVADRPRLEVGILAEAYKPYVKSYSQIRENLEKLEQDLNSRSGVLDERLQELREMEQEYLSHLAGDIGKAIKEAEKLLRDNETEGKDWRTYRQICQTTLAAIDKTTSLCMSNTLPLGAFHIVYKVLIADTTQVIDPYMRLFDEILTAYHLRDSGNIMVLQMEMDKAGV